MDATEFCPVLILENMDFPYTAVPVFICLLAVLASFPKTDTLLDLPEIIRYCFHLQPHDTSFT
jgi:hypothetical protein